MGVSGVGTDAGLNRLRRKCLFALGQSQGLGFGATESLAEPTPGVIWVGKPNDGLYRWDGKSFNRLTADSLSPHGLEVTTMLVTRDGFCWVATADRLLLYKDPIAAADEVNIIEAAPTNITALAEDGQGALWMGTRDGTVRLLYENRIIAAGDFHQTNAISALMPDTDGSMWIGTDGNGLYRYRRRQYPPPGARTPGSRARVIRSLYLDAQDTLWIGTADEGAEGRWRNGRVTGQALARNKVCRTIPSHRFWRMTRIASGWEQAGGSPVWTNTGWKNLRPA